MVTWSIRYFAFATIVMGLFFGFVACGAKYYKVSLRDDTPQMGANAPGSDDPKAPNFGLHAPRGWVELPIRFAVSSELTQEQIKGLKQAMATWEMAVGKKLFEFEGVQPGISGDSFTDLYSSLDDEVNGHYLDDHWSKTGKSSVVLATTIWQNDPGDSGKIVTADIRYNHQYYVLGDSFRIKAESDREVVDMQTLALHELGHLIGLAHMPPASDPQSIMNPALYIGEGLANRRLSRGDIARIQKIYGCEGKACNIDGTLAEINALEQSQRNKEDKTSETTARQITSSSTAP